jgi:hypothetical protein
MGGFVARAACKLHNSKEDVLGVIHGVHPAAGAAAAYWRCKAGFERASFYDVMPWVLGTNGEEVTCIFGNSPAPLELLPNKHYKDSSGNAAWLRFPQQDGTIASFPASGDPYEQIYKTKDNIFWRMINPTWLEPGAGGKGSKYADQDIAWDAYVQKVDDGKQFNDDLNPDRIWFHDKTVQLYSTGLSTVDKIIFSKEECTVKEGEHGNIGSWVTPSTRGNYIDYLDKHGLITSDASAVTHQVRMASPKECGTTGDSTVPLTSASIGDPNEKKEKTQYSFKGVDHQNFYKDSNVRSAVFDVIKDFAWHRIDTVKGCFKK